MKPSREFKIRKKESPAGVKKNPKKGPKGKNNNSRNKSKGHTVL